MRKTPNIFSFAHISEATVEEPNENKHLFLSDFLDNQSLIRARRVQRVCTGTWNGTKAQKPDLPSVVKATITILYRLLIMFYIYI